MPEGRAARCPALAVREQVVVQFSKLAPPLRRIPGCTLARYHDAEATTRAESPPARARGAGGPLIARRLENPFSSMCKLVGCHRSLSFLRSWVSVT